MCEKCDCGCNAFFCEHDQLAAEVELVIAKMFEEQDEERHQLRKYGYVIPDDKDITGSD